MLVARISKYEDIHEKDTDSDYHRRGAGPGHAARPCREKGQFRADVNAVDVRLVVGALCFFRVSNRYTFGALFDIDLTEPHIRRRHRQMIVDAVLRFLRA